MPSILPRGCTRNVLSISKIETESSSEFATTTKTFRSSLTGPRFPTMAIPIGVRPVGSENIWMDWLIATPGIHIRQSASCNDTLQGADTLAQFSVRDMRLPSVTTQTTQTALREYRRPNQSRRGIFLRRLPTVPSRCSTLLAAPDRFPGHIIVIIGTHDNPSGPAIWSGDRR